VARREPVQRLLQALDVEPGRRGVEPVLGNVNLERRADVGMMEPIVLCNVDVAFVGGNDELCKVLLERSGGVLFVFLVVRIVAVCVKKKIKKNENYM
jgi:hypothetical protein